MGSGSGTTTPIIGGAPGTALRASALPYTLLSAHRFARMLGIAPLHFAGGTAASLDPAVFPAGGSCGDVWARHDWQQYSKVSHESLLYAIKDAEREIMHHIGYPSAPTWITEEEIIFPRDFFRASKYQVVDIRGFRKSMHTRLGRVLSGGRRAVTLLGTATTAGSSLVYTDEDGDSFYETATITLTGLTGVSDVNEIKAYFTGMNGEQEWEIRPCRSKTLSSGTLTMVFDSWLLIDPDLQSEYPTDEGFTAIDVTLASFVTSVDVYREYNDTSDASAQFRWEAAEPSGSCTNCSGLGCVACSDTTQNGCLQVRNSKTGEVVPVPASYSDGSWTVAAFDVCRAPDRVYTWYYAGVRDERFKRGAAHDPLSNYMAWAIIWLAIARLELPPCSCKRLADLFETLRIDLTASTTGVSHFTSQEIINNPLGTHRGEVMAWRRIQKGFDRKLSVAVL